MNNGQTKPLLEERGEILPFPREHAPLYQLHFEDHVGQHFRMASRTTSDCHVIDMSLTTKVPEIAQKWPERMTCSNSFVSASHKLGIDQAIFQMSETCAVSLDSRYREWGSACMIVARTLEEAQTTCQLLVENFGVPETKTPEENPVFRILALEDKHITAHRTSLVNHPDMTPEQMDLSYGNGFSEWTENLRSVISGQPSSLTLLQGPPGTGKTSFLRWLIANGHEDADYYFIPVTCIDLLSNPNLTDYWLRECHNSRKPKVLIIEDAEMLLMRRGPDNGHWVGNLLNITDGIMGDALRFHIVCSMNCPIADVDPALLRPGRLAASWIFHPLDFEQAKRLTALLEKPCPQKDFPVTLAEIYKPAALGLPELERRMGFHRSQ